MHLSLSIKEILNIMCVLCRHGGGIGDASIRKMSYFEGSIDPEYKVGACIYVKDVP